MVFKVNSYVCKSHCTFAIFLIDFSEFLAPDYLVTSRYESLASLSIEVSSQAMALGRPIAEKVQVWTYEIFKLDSLTSDFDYLNHLIVLVIQFMVPNVDVIFMLLLKRSHKDVYLSVSLTLHRLLRLEQKMDVLFMISPTYNCVHLLFALSKSFKYFLTSQPSMQCSKTLRSIRY